MSVPNLIVSRDGTTVTIDIAGAEGFERVKVYKSTQFNRGYVLLENVNVENFPIVDTAEGNDKYKGSFVQTESNEIWDQSEEVWNTSEEFFYKEDEKRKSGSRYTIE